MLKIPDHVRSAHDQDGAVILDVHHGQMFRLNVVGSRILELLKQEKNEEQIVCEISREFAVAQEVVTADVRQFLAHLEKYRLLGTKPSTTCPRE